MIVYVVYIELKSEIGSDIDILKQIVELLSKLLRIFMQ